MCILVYTYAHVAHGYTHIYTEKYTFIYIHPYIETYSASQEPKHLYLVTNM